MPSVTARHSAYIQRCAEEQAGGGESDRLDGDDQSALPPGNPERPRQEPPGAAAALRPYRYPTQIEY